MYMMLPGLVTYKNLSVESEYKGSIITQLKTSYIYIYIYMYKHIST